MKAFFRRKVLKFIIKYLRKNYSHNIYVCVEYEAYEWRWTKKLEESL